METSTLTIIGALITIVVGAYATFKKSNAENNASTIAGEVANFAYWKDRTKAVEDRLSALELGVEERERSHRAEIKEKNERISILEERVDYLEEELSKQLKLNTKVDDAKASLHQDVDDQLNNLKQ